MINFSIWKIFGYFSTILIILLFLGGTLIGVGTALKDGDWKSALSTGGGRIFALDNALVEETDYLIEKSTDDNTFKYDIVFHLVYALSILFLFFFVAMFLYKLGNWIFGIKAFNPATDLLILFLVVVFFFTIEFLYTLLILNKTIFPFQGIWHFCKNIPLIMSNIF